MRSLNLPLLVPLLIVLFGVAVVMGHQWTLQHLSSVRPVGSLRPCCSPGMI